MSAYVTSLAPKIQGFSNYLLIIGDFKSSFGNQKRQDNVTVLSKTPVQKKFISEHQNHELWPLHHHPFRKMNKVQTTIFKATSRK